MKIRWPRRRKTAYERSTMTTAWAELSITMARLDDPRPRFEWVYPMDTSDPDFDTPSGPPYQVRI